MGITPIYTKEKGVIVRLGKYPDTQIERIIRLYIATDDENTLVLEWTDPETAELKTKNITLSEEEV